ncbi:MAG TPA: J domain-containing protein [Bradyrhizobium sp.]|uniref:J domain-containing protein n=1 Tax=Bradyrhizobium sp. TaxID=376 RepID=UPI002D0BC3D8|nr:J domain-containing protein [Bradyrhizobium sp.]HLZ03125.1 J domain-containing protein [Bradyrhizobium sp.]
MWEELGIAPSEDPKAIRRAYAARLKKLDPDRDPAAFARLREALEWALYEVAETTSAFRAPRAPTADLNSAEDGLDPPDRPEIRRPPSGDRFPGTHEQIAADGADEAASASLTATASEDALLDELESALHARNTAGALALYYRAAATGAVPLHAEPLLDRLFSQAIEPTLVQPAAFREFARITGWDEHESKRSVLSELRQRVLARLVAEDWYETLLATAERRNRATRKRARLARLVLARIGKHWMPRVKQEALRTLLDEFRLHERSLSDRISPAWIQTLERRWRRRAIARTMLLTLFVAALLIDWWAILIAEMIDRGLSAGAILIAPFATAFLLWLLTLLTRSLLDLIRQRQAPIGRDPPGADGH